MALSTVVTIGDLLTYYEVGNPVVVAFTYLQGTTFVDPSPLPTVTVIDPTLVSTSPTAVKVAAGLYTVTVPAPAKAGRWRLTITSTSPVTEASAAFSVIAGASS